MEGQEAADLFYLRQRAADCVHGNSARCGRCGRHRRRRARRRGDDRRRWAADGDIAGGGGSGGREHPARRVRAVARQQRGGRQRGGCPGARADRQAAGRGDGERPHRRGRQRARPGDRRSGHWCRLAAGDLLFRQGDPSDAVYFVVAGRRLAILSRSGGSDGSDRSDDRVAELGRGEVVGELGLLDDAPRAATQSSSAGTEDQRLPEFSGA